jgi:hypothetical protein
VVVAGQWLGAPVWETVGRESKCAVHAGKRGSGGLVSSRTQPYYSFYLFLESDF